MNAQEKVLEYVKQHSTFKPAHFSIEEFAGLMVKQDGIVIARTPSSTTSAKLSRQGNVITVTEVTVSKANEIVDGKLIERKVETSTDVLSINL